MKNTKPVILAAILTACLISAVIFYSCTKSSTNPCANIACLNGGACSNGVCICPTGWTGTYCQTAVVTYLSYQNDTYTPVTISVNGGGTQVIPVGTYITFSGNPGTSASAYATTMGTNIAGGQVGLLLYWNLSDVFPTSGTSTVYIDVSSSYFFLRVRNTNPSYGTSTIYVNYGLTEQTSDGLDIYNNGILYNAGYYDAFTNTEIYITSYPSGTYWTNYPSFANIINQYYNLTLY
jgi:hypothetical protein